ncbi:MAG: fimbrillin family protein [Bacteroidales bacterium]|nr:fimbrillin family protein [Bacteroidales bacterium]
MKKYLFSAALATTLLATSCSDNDLAENTTPDGQREMINLSVGLGNNTPDMAKRASGTPTYDGFKDETRILMRIQSDDDEAATGNHRYTKTLAKADAETQESKIYSTMSMEGSYVRYWDDAFGRNAHLSVYAVAIPNKSDDKLLPWEKLKGPDTSKGIIWETDPQDNNIEWSVTTDEQTTTILEEQDLVYSRNIRKGADDPEAGRYVWSFKNDPQGYVPNIEQPLTDKNVFTKDRMRFTLSDPNDETSPGKFDKGHLIFNHALSRLTITIKSGEGFDVKNKFVLSGDGVQALDMNISGTLDVSTGKWAEGAATGKITTKPDVVRTEGTTPSAYYKTSMQMLPGYAFNNGNTTNVLKFTIDDNEYYITQDLIFDALKDNAANNGLSTTEDNKYTMEQGKNYVLTITVNKTPIANITATLAKWEDVAAKEQELYNSYVTLSLKNTEGQACEDFDLYRLGVGDGNIHTSQTTGSTADDYENYKWGGNYTEKATTTDGSLSKADNYDKSKQWKTTWFFDDNKTFYHFRTVKAGTTIEGATGVNADATDDYFTIHDGPISGTNEVDPHWGAPLNNNFTGTAASKYNIAEGPKEGYTYIIYKAIGSTTGTIAIQEFHMLSEIQVIVKTKSEAEGGVKLYDNTKEPEKQFTTVTLYQFARNGQVKMGNGFVTALDPANYATEEQPLTSPGNTPETFFATNPTETNAFTWRVVPQTLSRGDNKTDKVAIKIQTPDNNLYYCIDDLSEIPVNGTSNPIDYWKPNHSYTYTFIISKKGIDQITCTVADWIDVKAADKDITLED